MSSDLCTFNGLNAVTGDYLLDARSVHDVANLARGQPLDSAQPELRFRYEISRHRVYGPIEGVDPSRLSEAGWGVIFKHDADPAIRDALRPLLEHRRAQAGARFHEYWRGDGLRAGETKTAFLTRHRHGPGAPDPDRVPYYLLLVGDPEQIPYRFQYLLDVQFAVGRIAFETVDDYARYARSVVQAETVPVLTTPRAMFFGTRNPGDQATHLSADELLGPLHATLSEQYPNWSFDKEIGIGATKARLASVLSGTTPPSLFFSACHGIGLPADHPLQRAHQGALLCQDWPGPLQHRGPLAPDWYFAADDVDADANLQGMVAFVFACYGGGTPRLDDFAHLALTQPAPIAPRAFVAALPQRMLSLPGGGALAVIAHVERAWGYSFSWPGVGTHHQVFSATLRRLLNGMPVGHALEYFNSKYAELSTELSAAVEDAKYAVIPDELTIASMWTALNDARSYVVIGDPAVRLSTPS